MIHMVQQSVVGVAGATVPVAAPPDGAQEPPIAAVDVVIADLDAAPEQPVGADSVITPPLQLGSPKVETSDVHWMPVGGSQTQALQAREST